MTDRFKLSFVDIGETYGAFLYDMAETKIVWEITDYSDRLIGNLNLVRASISQEIGYLRSFWSFLATKNIELYKVNDDTLDAFREYAKKHVKDSRAHREGGSEVVHATVNAKLVRIYDWLFWLQETARLPEGTIGYRNAKVQSALRGSSLSREAKANKEISTVHKYPLLLPVKSAKSKHNVAKFIPTEQTLDLLHEKFFERASPHIRHRNSLLVDVAAYTGFRRNSIQSLHVDQFLGADYVATERDTVIIKPIRQKFGYGDAYEIPAILHDDIRTFISTHRAELIAKKKVSLKTTGGAVFISERTCKELDDRTISTIVSKAMRAFGAPKGTSIHSFRAKFLIETIAEEYEERRELGLDTSAETIARAAALKVGHRSVKSARAYTESHASREVARSKANRMRQARDARDEIARLKAEIEQLKAIQRDGR